MKKLLIIIFFISNVYCQNNNDINNIKNQFKLWQPILNDTSIISEVKYNIVFGKNYEYEKWVEKVEDSSIFIASEVRIYTDNKLGNVLKIFETSPSGDWFISSEHYYRPGGKLYFIFWSMNTFYAEDALTVERRVYFNPKGEKIRALESVYKMNTKDIVENANYFDKEINHWKSFNKLPFNQ